jgi:hypothetical protein
VLEIVTYDVKVNWEDFYFPFQFQLLTECTQYFAPTYEQYKSKKKRKVSISFDLPLKRRRALSIDLLAENASVDTSSTPQL